jgi:hypothetical protein
LSRSIEAGPRGPGTGNEMTADARLDDALGPHRAGAAALRLLNVQGLQALADEEFVRLWTALIGGPPAIMIERPLMVALLLESVDPRLSHLIGRADGPRPGGCPSGAGPAAEAERPAARRHPLYRGSIS